MATEALYPLAQLFVEGGIGIAAIKVAWNIEKQHIESISELKERISKLENDLSWIRRAVGTRKGCDDI